ncbi:MAG TPA: carboxypeptidase-like regulatory domain-containing protein, partial [Vicinamibacterales bacterium]|nr:carboxypeptidase-like regulatory domain-containing protein [Vicinamibacterales bacterium]
MNARTASWVVGCLILTGGTTFAQSRIAGVVKDSTGGVLPGVSVEASSPALIEKARTAVTDGQGAYDITDLRPGVYTVTFTLQGFATVRRDGIELAASFIATVNAELRVGEVAETLTVTGEAPMVDTREATRAKTIGQAELSTIPMITR